jgi:hypothetical protein
MSAQLQRLQRLILRGLTRTAELWPDVQVAYAWVHQAARILKNETGLAAGAVHRRLHGLIGAMIRHRVKAGRLADAIAHFHKVTRSYSSGLFHCYAIPGLPRTNNDLEQLFGSHRHHDRRATGRKMASPATVLRGPVRLLAATATRLQPTTGRDLAHADQRQWRDLRARLDHRRHSRVLRTRFRRNPQRYLSELEHLILQQTLPP